MQKVLTKKVFNRDAILKWHQLTSQLARVVCMDYKIGLSQKHASCALCRNALDVAKIFQNNPLYLLNLQAKSNLVTEVKNDDV